LLHKFLNTARRLHTRDQKCHQPIEGKIKIKKNKFTLPCKISPNPWKWEFKYWQHSNNALTNHRISRARKPRL
jgi:hypothetical protein